MAEVEAIVFNEALFGHPLVSQTVCRRVSGMRRVPIWPRRPPQQAG